jgi:hypothetical protein
MKTIKGKHHYQVKDLIEDLKLFPQDAIIFAIWHGKRKTFHERPIYKVVETAEPGEVYFYLGDDRRITNHSTQLKNQSNKEV